MIQTLNLYHLMRMPKYKEITQTHESIHLGINT